MLRLQLTGNKSFKYLLMLICLCQFNLARAISNISITPDDLNINATTNYSISFNTDRNLTPGGFIGVSTSNSSGPDFSNVPTGNLLVTTSSGNFTANLSSVSTANAQFDIPAGVNISSGSTISFVLTNIVNPAVIGQGPDYGLLTFDFTGPPPGPVVVSHPGSIYTTSTPNGPSVIAPIADLTAPGSALPEADGTQVIVNDLNTVFEDGNGDVMTFTVEPGNDTNIATGSINNNTLSITPIASGTTTFTIKATSINGDATDTFDVRVIGELDNASVTPQNLDSGATGVTYDVSFTPAGSITSDHNIWIQSATAGGPDYSNSTVTVSGGTLTGQLFSPGAVGTVIIQITGGSASSADTVSITINNVENPGASGLGPDYNLLVRNFSGNDIDRTTVAGSVYDAVGLPTVIAPIDNQFLFEANGTTEVIADLNTVFTDGDGDTLTFSIEPGNDPNIATAAVNGNQLNVTATGPGTTTITVKASDLPAGEGEVTDSFDVTVTGILDNATIIPTSFEVNEQTTYQVAFTLSSQVNIDGGDDFLFILNNSASGGADYTNATLDSFSLGTLTANINSQSDSSISLEFTSGQASMGDNALISLANVNNPIDAGIGPDYDLSLFRVFPSPTMSVEESTVSGDTYTNADIIFSDGFESSPDGVAKSYLNGIINDQGIVFDQPFYDTQTHHFVFLGEILSRDDSSGVMRSKEDVMQWLETLLKEKQPFHDWDQNGNININDDNPLGIIN